MTSHSRQYRTTQLKHEKSARQFQIGSTEHHLLPGRCQSQMQQSLSTASVKFLLMRAISLSYAFFNSARAAV